jgi:hypothetical protein
MQHKENVECRIMNIECRRPDLELPAEEEWLGPYGMPKAKLSGISAVRNSIFYILNSIMRV